MTLIMILVIALTIIAVYNRHKMEQIVGLSHREILNKHQKAFNTYKGWLIFAIILFTGGYLLAKCYPMYETENYEYWFFGTQKGTREVLTASAWWSYPARTGHINWYSCINRLLRPLESHKKISENDTT